jgi:hypothetical protein
MKTKKLKLPDGGSFDLEIPDGFGGPPNLGTTTQAGKKTMLVVGTIAGAMAGFLIVLVAMQFGTAIEK